MRNLKKFLALVLAMLMILSVSVISMSAAEADVADYKDAATRLQGLKILKGDENGNLMLENGVTRWQAALFFVQALTGKTDAATWNAEKTSAIFSDVPEYGTAIDYAYGIKLILGRGNGVYGYADPITYQDMLVMAVRALGYETADMTYPYGYILAAQKLGLTEVVEDNQVNYKAALNRGETAQIIWNMLGTEVAVTDPLSDKILYPGESGLTEAITDKAIERETLLEKSGYASGELFVQIASLNEAEDEDDIATVTVTGDVAMEIAAADLGIDVETARNVDYVGKYMTILVDCEADEFEDAYNVDAEESDASVVIATMQATTTVNNVAATAIKYDADKQILTLGTEKFDLKKFDDDFIKVEQGEFNVADFTYTTKDGYTADSDRYVIVEYFVEEKTVDDETVKTLHVYVSNVIFAQYVERTIKSNETGKDEKFVVLGYLGDEETTNIEGEDTYVVEKTLGKNYKLTENTTSLSKLNGNASRTVEVEGEAIASGDFAWVNYNSVDNVLTIVKNVGEIKTGRLTASSTKETVKINGSYYEFGFAADKAGLTEFDNATVKGYISALESGKDNVQYILADGKIVWLAACGDVASDDTTFPFVILGMDDNRPDTELLADLLDKKEIKESELLDGFYFVNGAIAVPVMDTKTGEWKIAYVGTVVNEWDAEDEEFDNVYNVSKLETVLDAYEVDEIPAKQKDLYDAVVAVFADAPILAAVEEADGVYTIAAKADFVPSADSTQGLTFSDSSAKTNYITADPDDEDGARVTLNDDTVIIAINGNTVMSRVGVQSKKYSLAGVATFYAAGADLIVLVTDNDLYTCANGGKWSKGKALAETTKYYIALDNEGAEYEVDADDTFTLTVSNVFDVAAMEVVDKVTVTGDVDDYNTLVKPILDGIEMGKLLVLDEDVLSICDDDLGDVLADLFEYDKIDVSDIEFKNADTLSGILELTAADALDKINITVATLDLTGLDADEYDFDDLCLAADYYEKDGVTPAFKGTTEYAINDEFSGVVYEIAGDMVEEIAEPTEGVFDQYIIDALEYYVAIHAVDKEFADEDADIQALEITMYAAASYDDDANVLDIVIYKLITVANLEEVQ